MSSAPVETVASNPAPAAVPASPAATAGASAEGSLNGPNPEHSNEELDELAKKVFVRRLAPSTKEADLKDLFVPVLDVTHVQIIRRGARNQGYGFVSFASADDAATAIAKYNGKELNGREIQVEPLKRPSRGATQKRQGGKPRKQAKTDGTSSSTPATAPTTDAEADSATEKPKANKKKTNINKKKNLKAKKAAAAQATSGTETAEHETPKGKTGEPSPTLVFVANLAFDVDQTELKTFFEENSKLSVKSLYIARTLVRKPRKVIKAEQEAAKAEIEAKGEASVPKPTIGTRRSRGYAFVDFETHEQQQEAISSFHDKELHGRKLVLKVALENEERKKKNEEIAQAKAKKTEAATNHETTDVTAPEPASATATGSTTTTDEQGATEKST